MRKIGKKKPCAPCREYVGFQFAIAILNTQRGIEKAILFGGMNMPGNRLSGIKENERGKSWQRKNKKQSKLK